MNASGRPDESLAVEFVGPLQASSEDSLISGKPLSISLQKGQLRVNIGFQPFHSANLEVAMFKFWIVFKYRSVSFSTDLFLGHYIFDQKLILKIILFPFLACAGRPCRYDIFHLMSWSLLPSGELYRG